MYYRPYGFPHWFGGGNDFYNYLCLEIPSCKEVNMPPTENRNSLSASIISERFFSQNLKLVLVSRGNGGLRPGARTQPAALPALPGIILRLRAGLTEVTRAWGSVRPRPALGLRTPTPVHARVGPASLATCHRPFSRVQSHLLLYVACRFPVWSLRPRGLQ